MIFFLIFCVTSGFSTLLNQDTLDVIYRYVQKTPFKKIFERSGSEASFINEAIPTAYDSRAVYPNCKSLTSVLDQKKCGSCWAFATTGSAADALCINGIANVIPSPQRQICCDNKCLEIPLKQCDYGCNGGVLTAASLYIENNGIVSDECIPYEENSSKPCFTSCSKEGVKMEVYKGLYAKIPSIMKVSENEMKKGIMIGGSIAVAMNVFQSFTLYKGGVYNRTDGDFLGNHAVRLVGWNDTAEVPYWIMINSWGTEWGMNGTCYYLKGKNLGNIESQTVYFSTTPPTYHGRQVSVSFSLIFIFLLVSFTAVLYLLSYVCGRINEGEKKRDLQEKEARTQMLREIGERRYKRGLKNRSSSSVRRRRLSSSENEDEKDTSTRMIDDSEEEEESEKDIEKVGLLS